MPLLKRFKSATGLEESSFEPIFDYISEYAQRQVDFRWDKLAVVLARANLLLFFYIYSEELHLPSVDTLESQINKTSSTRRLLLYSANRREGEAKRKLLEIERRWFSQAVDRIGDLEEWVDALQKEQSITVGCNETVINFVDVAVQKEYKNRFSRREDLSEIPPDLLRRLGSLGSAVHAEAQFREYVPMIELDRYWDDQAANRMEKLWEDSEHSGQRNLLEKRINYRLKNDFGDNSICAVTALMLLSLDQNNQVNESTFLERLIRRYPDDGDRLRVAFYVLNQPELNTLRNAEQVSKIMHSYLLRTARENRDVFCTPGTTQLSQPLANELSLMQVQCESQYLELSKILSGAGIRLDASRHGDRGLKKSMLGGHVLILILAFVCALLVVGMVGYCACFLLPERISVIGLLILILVVLIQQLIVLIVRLLRSN